MGEFALAHFKTTRLLPARRLEREAPVECAVLAIAFPGVTNFVAGVSRLQGVADFSLAELHERVVPDEVGHLAAEIVRHRFDVNGSLGGTYFVRLTLMLEGDGRAADRHDVA